MTNKLQAMMQTHCNEALRLLQIGSLTAGDTNVQNTSKQVMVFEFIAGCTAIPGKYTLTLRNPGDPNKPN